MEYREDEYLMISGIQHFEFCRRQWALIHIEQQWNDNYLTVAGELVHDRAHDKDLTEKRGKTIQLLSEKSSPIRTVAPFVGAWIEITDRVTIDGKQRVAPFVGARMIIFDDGFSKETSIFRAILLSTDESVCMIIS